MLRITECKSADAARSYYTQGLAREDYYAGAGGGREAAGTWGGNGASRLGLEGVVDQREFGRLCDNRHPVTGGRLTPRTKAQRRVGYDLNFHAPKSVSLLAQVAGDARVERAFAAAVDETMRELEADAEARVRRRGADDTRVTGNLAWAAFTHHTARPVNGVPDPHLHAHCFTFNATWDGEEAKWKAMDLGPVKRDAGYFEAAFHARLAGGLVALGYSVERTPDGRSFEVAGVPRELVDAFSSRTQQVEAAAAAKGIADAAGRDRLAAKTRSRKRDDLTDAQLRDLWDAKMTDRQRDKLATVRGRAETLAAGHPGRGNNVPAGDLAAAVGRVLDHELERASVTPERRVLEGVLRAEVGRASVADAATAVDGRGDLVRRRLGGRVQVTTPGVLAEERRVLAFARGGRGVCRPLGERADEASQEQQPAGPTFAPPPPAAVEPAHRTGLLHRAGVAVLDWFAPVVPVAAADHQGQGDGTPAAPADPAASPGVDLNDQQRAAVAHVLASRDRVTLLRGAAGTGKTTLAREAVRQLEAAGRRVHGFAPSAEASRGVMRDEGFKDADTVARLLFHPKLQERVAGGVLWVDEAGLLGVRTTARLFNVAERHGCRLVLVGDQRQHAAVERGDALRLLEAEAGLKPAEVTAVVRQRGDYRRAVELLASGDVAGGFDRLDRLGAIREVPERENRHARLADDYLAAAAAGRTVLVVSPTHAEGEAVTNRIRDALRERGDLGDDEREVTRLRSLNWTEAQRADAGGYRPGLAVVFHQNARGFKRGERLEVTGVGDAGVLARRGDGSLVPLPLDQAARFGVFEQRALHLATGDLVRLTANGMDLNGRRVNNGATYRVAGFNAAGNLTLGPATRRQQAGADHPAGRPRPPRPRLRHDQPRQPGPHRRPRARGAGGREPAGQRRAAVLRQRQPSQGKRDGLHRRRGRTAAGRAAGPGAALGRRAGALAEPRGRRGPRRRKLRRSPHRRPAPRTPLRRRASRRRPGRGEGPRAA